MYKQHWGLNESLFTASGNSDLFYACEAQEEALARIQFLIGGSRRLGLLVGGEGFGKTAILNHVAAGRRKRQQPTALVNLWGLDELEFVHQLAESLGVECDITAPPVVAWRRIFDRFMTNQYQQLNTVILLDDAHEVRPEVLTAIIRLVQWQPAQMTGITTVLAATANRLEQVGRRLLELSELRIDLPLWEQSDTVGFLRYALERAGSDRPVFDVRALEEIQRRSEGVPRRIRQLAELALVAGAGQELPRVDPATILAVQEELQFPFLPTAAVV